MAGKSYRRLLKKRDKRIKEQKPSAVPEALCFMKQIGVA